MDRRDFLKVSSVSLMAMGADDVTVKMLEPSQEKKEGMSVRFLGTGAADWNRSDNRGEQCRLSSILVDKNISFDFTAGNIEMIPAGLKPGVVFYTHSHNDHYHPESALKIGVRKVYLSQTWYDIAKADFEKSVQEIECSDAGANTFVYRTGCLCRWAENYPASYQSCYF